MTQLTALGVVMALVAGFSARELAMHYDRNFLEHKLDFGSELRRTDLRGRWELTAAFLDPSGFDLGDQVDAVAELLSTPRSKVGPVWNELCERESMTHRAKGMVNFLRRMVGHLPVEGGTRLTW